MTVVLVYNVPGPDGMAKRGHAREFSSRELALARAAAILSEHPGTEVWLEQDGRILMSARAVARHCRRYGAGR